MNGHTPGPKQPSGPFGQPVLPNLAVRHLCPNCRTDPPNIVEEYSHGDLVCADCGTILGDRIVDTRSESGRTFAGDEGGDDPSRVGGPSNPLLGNASLDTIISGRDGRTGMSKDLMRAQNRANQSATGGGKSNAQQLQSAFARVAEKTDAMQLPRNVTEIAQHAYKIGDGERLARGRNDDALIAASIIFATRMAGAQRSFGEVCKVTRVTKAELGRVFKLLKAAIDKTGAAGPKSTTNTSDVVQSLLGRYSNYLDLGTPILNSAMHVAPLAMRLPTIDGRTPGAIAAGVLYFTTTLMEKSTTSKEIASVSGVSESTIKMICKKVAEELDQVIKPEWKDQFPKGYKDVDGLGSRNPRAASAAQTSRAGTPAPSGTSTPTVAN
ncbi:hypothetical protein CspeluHIS016_0211650 [Cutaneotrichosporon spelunceum]|uniref:Transcription initiation factor IIB n=1 Tax=Cutaneotrichosporon spelunceum TaxID=1672016 RepID=A0AAD3YBS7_9TREE|nr:hypothetical protein CspeluHIS016_0211650 [Cutaneotrichosporon spelunceum]